MDYLLILIFCIVTFLFGIFLLICPYIYVRLKLAGDKVPAQWKQSPKKTEKCLTTSPNTFGLIIVLIKTYVITMLLLLLLPYLVSVSGNNDGFTSEFGWGLIILLFVITIGYWSMTNLLDSGESD